MSNSYTSCVESRNKDYLSLRALNNSCHDDIDDDEFTTRAGGEGRMALSMNDNLLVDNTFVAVVLAIIVVACKLDLLKWLLL